MVGEVQLTNLNKVDWQKDIKEFIPDKSLNWKLAKVISIDNFY